MKKEIFWYKTWDFSKWKISKKKVKNTKGFTLVELIIVITILAILGTIAFISLSEIKGDTNKYKYRIYTDTQDIWYNTDRYDEYNNCITFVDNYSKKQKFCGTYSIVER